MINNSPVTYQDNFKDLSVTDLHEISSSDFNKFNVTDLEHLFEAICFKLEQLEDKKNDYIDNDKDTDSIEDDIYELESLQYDVQTEIEFRS